ncbi:hypothetical protein DRJ25_00345 [Candidatus Woesearchaeota archaeon]|nr:MAG: hypothetical protein DRJ25_00345 [Candidatus Woesearchaeota archaeon]
MNLKKFMELSTKEIKKIVLDRKKPKTVAIMLDGSRRLLKLEEGHHYDSWLYDKKHIQNLMYKSMDCADFLFEIGVDTVIGPLASIGNLQRENFMPEGLERLLNPLLEDYSLEILKRHKANIFFYGDLDFAKSLQMGFIVDDFKKRFKRTSFKNCKKNILLGIGFLTNRETVLIAEKAIEFYKEKNRKPTYDELVFDYYGLNISPIDIFIRTNELKASGGLTPLLVDHDTQFYFPISPGILSMNATTLKRILHDYLFNRSLSHGRFKHKPITSEQAKKIKEFYSASKNDIIGIGQRIGDIWVHKPSDYE